MLWIATSKAASTGETTTESDGKSDMTFPRNSGHEDKSKSCTLEFGGNMSKSKKRGTYTKAFKLEATQLWQTTRAVQF
jgi:hypothetical protein